MRNRNLPIGISNEVSRQVERTAVFAIAAAKNDLPVYLPAPGILFGSAHCSMRCWVMIERCGQFLILPPAGDWRDIAAAEMQIAD